MLIKDNLNTEFKRAVQAEALGLFRSAMSTNGPYSYLTPDLVREPRIVSMPSPKKVGLVNAGNHSMESGDMSNVERRAIMRYAGKIQYSEPEMMGPLFDPINWFLPYTYKVLNRWIRYYDRFDPWIGNAIDMHSQVPLSRFTLTGIDDKGIQRLYEDVVEKVDLYQRLLETAREYWLLGEVFPFSHWDETNGIFDQIVILNPDYMIINASPLPGGQFVQFEMEPDDATVALVKSSDPRAVEVRGMLDPVIIDAVESGTNIPLDPFSVAHIARKASPYDLRGTSILLRCFLPETRVVMNNGTWKSIKDIEIGEKVITHKGRSRTVISTNHHVEENALLYRVEVEGQVEPIECTHDHRFLVWTARRECACGCGKLLSPPQRKNGIKFVGNGAYNKVLQDIPEESFAWLAIEDLREGDFLCIPATNEVSEDLPSYETSNDELIEITPGIARLLGYFLAEGCFLKNQQGRSGLEFDLHYDEKDTWGQDIKKLFMNEFGLNINMSSYISEHSCQITISNKQLAEMFYYYCNEYCAKKRVPEEVLHWSLELQKQLFIGYYRGDGMTKETLGFSSNSRVLAEQMCMILRNFGLDFKVYPHAIDTSSDCSPNPCTDVIISITTDGAREFFTEVFPDRTEFVTDAENMRHIVDTVLDLRKQGLSRPAICKVLHEQNIFPHTSRNKSKKWGSGTIERIEKRKEYIYGIRSKANRFRIGDYIVIPIKKIEQFEYSGEVYCLTVEEDHSFTLYRGISVENCLKDMLYCDKLREAQMAVADRLITPLQIYKLGDPKGDWLPEQDQIDDMAALLAQGRDDPNFALVGHFGLQVEYVGATGKVLPIVPEFDFVRDRILAALFTNRAMTDGSGPTYAGTSVAFEILQLRYMSLRGLLEMYVRDKVFKPIAEANKLYIPLSTAELNHGIRPSVDTRQLAVPDINWLEKIRLLDDAQMKRFILQLRMRMDIPLETVCDIFDLNYAHIKNTLTKELGTAADPMWRTAVSKAFTGAWEQGQGKPKPGMPGVSPGGGVGGMEGLLGGGGGAEMPMPGETAPGSMGPAPREVAPEGGTTPGGPEIPGAYPAEIGPGASIPGTALGDMRMGQNEAERELLLSELKRQQDEIDREEAIIEESGMTRKVFGYTATTYNKNRVFKKGSSFYTIDR